jgi:hypothetical protein
MEEEVRLVYVGENPATEAALVKTINALPEAIQHFVLERCAFASVGKVLGITLPGSLRSWPGAEAAEWLIVLRDNEDTDAFAAIIAHEIAHAWLRHNYFEDQGIAVENAAAALAASWGFRGAATDIRALV